MLPTHWEAVRSIYQQGIDTGNATFQTSAPDWNEWNNGHLQTCRIIALNNDSVLGWAALTPVSGRCVYAGVAEVSVYVAEGSRGKNIGNMLLKELISESEKNNIWTLQAGIFPENIGSIRLHEANDFRIVGFREKIGKMNGKWRDTILLERRSNVAGVD